MIYQAVSIVFIEHFHSSFDDIKLHNTSFFITSTKLKFFGGKKCISWVDLKKYLKNQGYHVEHNYGHGKENLC